MTNMMTKYETRDQVIEDAKTVCKNFGIYSIYSNVYSKNPSNDLPYHNWYHTNSVIVNCAAGAAYHNLSYDDTRDLLLAALFHDFAHSGGTQSDELNVKTAILHFKEMYHGLLNTDKIAKFIDCTEYPFTKHPFCIEMKILRDADLMQWLMPDSEVMIAIGLRKEVELAQGKEIPMANWLDMQLQFLETAKFYSTWGINIYREKICPLVDPYVFLHPEELGMGKMKILKSIKYKIMQMKEKTNG